MCSSPMTPEPFWGIHLLSPTWYQAGAKCLGQARSPVQGHAEGKACLWLLAWPAGPKLQVECQLGFPWRPLGES